MMPWRLFAEIYTAYQFSCWVTPEDWTKLRATICLTCVAIVTGLNLLPIDNFPMLSLFRTLIGIPCQLYMIFALFYYIQPAIKSTPLTVVMVMFSAFEIIWTVLKINQDVEKIQKES